MNPLWNPEKFRAALVFATEAHNGQTIPATDHPYVVHPVEVAMEVMAAIAVEGVDHPDLALQCALLHDVLEDTPTTAAALEKLFGRAVTAGVAALSKDESLPKDQAMRDSLNRIRKEPREVWMVKLADRISNLRPPPPYWNCERCAYYHQEAQLILGELASASPMLAARLAEKIGDYSRYTV